MSSECDIYILAAMWRERLSRAPAERDPDDWRELQEWLARDPRNRLAFEQITTARMAHEAAGDDPRIRAWRRQALSRPYRAGVSKRWWQAAAAAVVLGIGVLISSAIKPPTITIRGNNLIFDGATLAKAVREINSRSPSQLVLADPSLADLRVSGVFDLKRVDGFIDGVTAHYPIAVSPSHDGRIVLIRRDIQSL